MTETVIAPAETGSLGEIAWKRRGLLSIFLVFLITLPLLTKIFTSDFGTHIAMGRQIVRTHGVPDTEFLNYPSLGMKNPNGEWGFQAVLYLVFAAGGVYGVSFFCWAVTMGIFLLLHRSTVLRGANPFLAALALFAFSGFLRIRIQPRPEIFTYLFISLVIYIFSEYFFGKRRWVVYLFPAVVLVWANMHPTYLMAFLLCGAFVADRLLSALWRREFGWGQIKGWIVPPVAVGALGLVLCGLNPHGYDALLLPLHLISRGGGPGGGGSQVLQSISELTPIRGTGLFVYYKAAAVFAAASLLMGAFGRRIRLLDLFLFGIAFKGALDSARAVSMMGLFLSPGISLQLTGFLERVSEWLYSRMAALEATVKAKAARSNGARKKGGGTHRKVEAVKVEEKGRPARSWAYATLVAGIAAATLAFGGIILAFSFSQLEYGVGLTEHKFSLSAGEFLRKNPVKGNMFNFFDIGGFLDWQLYPQALTFIDGRTYNQKVFMEHQTVTSAMPGWEETLRRYGVTYAVLKSMDSSGAVLPLVSALANSPEWELVFSDGLFLVFVRNTPDNRDYINRFRVPKEKIFQQIVWEAYHYMYLGVSPLMAYETMSRMYELMGNQQAAIDSLRKALEIEEVPFLRARLSQLEQGGSPFRGAGAR
jgi:hypothetical protein